ncbi:MAG: hypothetical protein SWE60_05830 [Thermodesulfobacteriota bacterium]|nr:hypothetical protein [Thermodesulfobacteriota bacterium]MDY6987946.1 hypothetical protein [Thermodesulfobacteriota bacterium]
MAKAKAIDLHGPAAAIDTLADLLGNHPFEGISENFRDGMFYLLQLLAREVEAAEKAMGGGTKS